MDVHVSESWESYIRSQVESGRYRSEGEVLDEALSLLKQRDQPRQDPDPGMGSIGAMREDADFLDEIVESAMKARREQPWRLPAGD